jgi:hypothetical protein
MGKTKQNQGHIFTFLEVAKLPSHDWFRVVAGCGVALLPQPEQLMKIALLIYSIEVFFGCRAHL